MGLALGAGGAPLTSERAEAVGPLRAKIRWSTPSGTWDTTGFNVIPTKLSDRSVADPDGQDRSAYVFFQSGTLTRQTNPNAATGDMQGQVRRGGTFCDRVTLSSSLDVQNAVVRVDQATFGPTKRDVHVKVALGHVQDPAPLARAQCPPAGLTFYPRVVRGPDGVDVLERDLPLDSADLGPGIDGFTPVALTVMSVIPDTSQIRGLTTGRRRAVIAQLVLTQDRPVRVDPPAG